jgi:hypothetical protein
LLARTVAIKACYADFTTVTCNHTAAPPTCDADQITAHALMLIDRSDAGRRPARTAWCRHS